jgi:hypothetical protein
VRGCYWLDADMRLYRKCLSIELVLLISNNVKVNEQLSNLRDGRKKRDKWESGRMVEKLE